jgi:putative ABC transport system ATP-binding protein
MRGRKSESESSSFFFTTKHTKKAQRAQRQCPIYLSFVIFVQTFEYFVVKGFHSITKTILFFNLFKTMIKLEKINKVYRTKEIETLALDNINFEVKEGEFVSVMGPSGCGKSTLLNIIGLLDEPDGGKLSLDEQLILNYEDKKTARLRNQLVGFIFQSFHLIKELNVYDNVELPLIYRKTPLAERKRKVLEALEKVGLSNRMQHYPSQLSGGQCQRAAIARAVAGDPKIILADEPTGNLDSKIGHEVVGILADLNTKGTTIVMVTHDEMLAKSTHRIVRLFDGRLVG